MMQVEKLKGDPNSGSSCISVVGPHMSQIFSLKQAHFTPRDLLELPLMIVKEPVATIRIIIIITVGYKPSYFLSFSGYNI